MQMYNLIEYSTDYSEAKESLWLYSADEATNFNAAITNANDFKSFKFKSKLGGNTVVQSAPNQPNGVLKNTTIAVPLKYLNKFWKSLKMSFIYFKTELNLNGRSIVFSLQMSMIMLIAMMLLIFYLL